MICVYECACSVWVCVCVCVLCVVVCVRFCARRAPNVDGERGNTWEWF